MSRKFNTKKFIKDVFNDRYAHQRTAIQRVVEVFLYPSFGAPLVPLWSPYGDSEMTRNRFEDSSKWCATGNIGLSVNKAGFGGQRTLFMGKRTWGFFKGIRLFYGLCC